MSKISVMVSGKGTTLRGLAENCSDSINGTLYGAVEIARVVANRECPAREVAEEFGLPFHVLKNSEIFQNPEEIDLWVMAGYLAKVTVPDELYGKVLNVHPSLIPKFCGQGMYGRHVHEAVIAANETVSGCTIHVVDNEYDHGPVIERMKVAVLKSDTAETLEFNVKRMEDMLYPRAILNHLRTLNKAKHRKSQWWPETPRSEEWFQEYDVPKLREKGWTNEAISKIFGPINT